MKKTIANKDFFADLRAEIKRSVPSKARFVRREPILADKAFFQHLRMEIACPEDLSKEITTLRETLAEKEKELQAKEMEISTLKSAESVSQPLIDQTLSRKEILLEFIKNVAKFSKANFSQQDKAFFLANLSIIFDRFYGLNVSKEMSEIESKDQPPLVINHFHEGSVTNQGQMNVGGGAINDKRR